MILITRPSVPLWTPRDQSLGSAQQIAVCKAPPRYPISIISALPPEEHCGRSQYTAAPTICTICSVLIWPRSNIYYHYKLPSFNLSPSFIRVYGHSLLSIADKTIGWNPHWPIDDLSFWKSIATTRTQPARFGFAIIPPLRRSMCYMDRKHHARMAKNESHLGEDL